MSLTFSDPAIQIEQIVKFIQQTFAQANKKQAVIAVSGGIDSALSLTLLTKALGAKQVTAALLPHHLQPMVDAHLIAKHVGLSDKNIVEIDIKPFVDVIGDALQVSESPSDAIRKGNLKARSRMICVFDLAKKLDALVCGTENKSEHYLGYFTRFGDAASDLEPLSHLYKTQVRQLAQFLELPAIFWEKPPSAGLWIGQTDETELGFTYAQADLVLEQLIDQKKSAAEIKLANVPSEIIQKVVAQVQAMQFKHQVPYVFSPSPSGLLP